MIRQDYLLRWFQQYVQWIAEIAGLIRRSDWEAALRRVDMALRGLLDLGPDSVQSLSDDEILARLTLDDPPPVVREKCLILATLLHQLGKIAEAQHRPDAARDSQLKALHLFLGLQTQPNPAALPDFVPTLQDLQNALKGKSLSPRTYAALMIHHEQAGRFAKAEDALFEWLRTHPADPNAPAMGEDFFRRLLVLSDDALVDAGFPRNEVLSGLDDLRAHSPARS